MGSNLRWLFGRMSAVFSIGLLVLFAGCPATSVDPIIGVWEGVFENFSGESYNELLS